MSDFLMIENGDGGEIDVTPDGDVVLDTTFFNAVYLSIFSGKSFYKQFETENSDDNHNVEAELSKPSTPDNLKNLANIIAHKLNWMAEQELAKSVDVQARTNNNNITDITIDVIQPDGNSERFGIVWDREKSELKRFGEIYGRV